MCLSPQASGLPQFCLNAVLVEFKMSKRRLAKLTGITYPMLCRLARPNANPTWATLHRLAQAIGCGLDAFSGKGGKCPGKSRQ